VAFKSAVANVSFDFDYAAPLNIKTLESIGEITIENLTGFTGLSTAQATQVASYSSLSAALGYVAGLNTANVVFTFQGDTYIYGDVLNNNALDSNDVVVKIAGSTNVAAVLALLN
jgi:hypothetical protein